MDTSTSNTPAPATMRRGRDLLRLWVVGQMDGTNLGSVHDLVFDHDTDEVLALVVAVQDLFGLVDAQIVPWHQVRLVGRDVVLVESGASKVHIRDEPRVQELLDRKTLLSGTRIYTTDGQYLGTLADAYLDTTKGRIVGYEISGGFVEDTLRGKKFLPAQHDKHIGKDAIVVPTAAAAELQPQPPTPTGTDSSGGTPPGAA